MVRSDLDRGIVNVGNMYRFHKLFERLDAGKETAIVFLGGSITQDCNASKHELCYAFRTYDWFRRKFPSAKINYVNAGIGGTTSQFGVARVEDDVLCHNPDAVFVEFSVNDSNNKKFEETYESLLRKILLYKTEPAVFTFNNVQYDDGVNAQDVHNEVARHYSLPIVSMKDSIYREILLGHFTSEDVSTDNLHPNDVGHGLLADVICNLLETIFDQYALGNIESQPYAVPDATVTEAGYTDSKRIRNEMTLLESFTSKDITVDDRVQNGARDCFKKGIFFNSEDSYVSLKLTFKKLSLQYLKKSAERMPLAAVYVDGKKMAVLDGNFDENWDCLYLHDICCFETEEEHNIRIETDNIPADCTQKFYLVSIITC